MRKLVMVFLGLVLLSGCAGVSVWAPDEMVERATYRHDGPPEIALFTMINNKTGAGAHTSLMINASQRVIFDPAGSFKHETIPERNDVIFGVTPAVAEGYTRYHARESFRVRVQTLEVSPELAEGMLRTVMENGAVAPAQCSRSTSRIMAQFFPGQIRQSWFPRKLADQFQQVAGVTERTLREYDSDDNSKVLDDWDPARLAKTELALVE
mgnify:CR=1 FL=1